MFPFRHRRAIDADTVEETTFDQFKINTRDRSPKIRGSQMSVRIRSLILAFVCRRHVRRLARCRPTGAAGAAGGRLLVTVVDPSGGVLPTATVTLTGLEDATKKAAVAPLKASEKGLAIFDKLVPGRYTLVGRVSRVRDRRITDVRLRAGGDNKHVHGPAPQAAWRMPSTVSRDRQEAAADRAPLFGTALTREQIELLSDDPDEMRRQLTEMAGPDAVFKVDSFEGRDLPPKAQIKSVRISRDQFAAESHYAGGLHIEIVTQPGLGPMRASTRFRLPRQLDGRRELVHDDQAGFAEPQSTASISAARSCRRRRRSRSTSAARTPTRSRTSSRGGARTGRSRMSR